MGLGVRFVEVRLAVHAQVARVALAPLAPASEVVPAARHAIGVPRTPGARSRHVLRVAQRHLVRVRVRVWVRVWARVGVRARARARVGVRVWVGLRARARARVRAEVRARARVRIRARDRVRARVRVTRCPS